MPDAKSGRVHILRHLAVPGGVAAEDTGNHFLLRLTRRSERCRSGSQISSAGLYERQRAKGRCRSVEGGWLFNGLKKGASWAFPALTQLSIPSVFIVRPDGRPAKPTDTLRSLRPKAKTD